MMLASTAGGLAGAVMATGDDVVVAIGSEASHQVTNMTPYDHIVATGRITDMGVSL